MVNASESAPVSAPSSDTNHCGHCDMPLAKCRTCGASIVWARSSKGKAWPLDAAVTIVAVPQSRGIETYAEQTGAYNWNPGMWKQVSGHVPHHTTCPNWRE